MSAGSDALAASLNVEKLTGPARALAEESVRIKHRLDQIEAQLMGDPAFLEFLPNLPETVAEVVVNRALTEARQQALALASVLKFLAAMEVEEAVPAADVADEMAKRRAAKLKRAQAAGQ